MDESKIAFLCFVKNEIVIRRAEPDDMQAVHELIAELAAFERASAEVEITVADLTADAFGTEPIAEIIVALEDEKVVGAALFYEKYSTWKGRCMHLEDFVVKQSHRRTGIGTLLFEAVIRIAAERKYARMDWQVLDWNKSAIAFYQKYGASLTSEWLDGRLTREDLKRFL